ncbi:MAG TPA: hypothetical protein ENI87_03130 [bacterium]|nr:hypothetical protein [bacterium]
MTKLSLTSLFCAVALMAGSTVAQARAVARPAPARPMARASRTAPRPPVGPRRLPGIPAVKPPVDHPALMGQPLVGGGQSQPRPRPVKVNPQPAKPDPATVGVKKSGRELRRAVAKVKALKWHKNLASAKAKARAEHKPILLLQTLGDIGGFA